MTKVIFFYAVIIIMGLFLTIDHFDYIPVTPRQIYKRIKCNIFGCVILWAFLIIVDPLLVFARFVWWILCIGRKED